MNTVEKTPHFLAEKTLKNPKPTPLFKCLLFTCNIPSLPHRGTLNSLTPPLI